MSIIVRFFTVLLCCCVSLTEDETFELCLGLQTLLDLQVRPLARHTLLLPGLLGGKQSPLVTEEGRRGARWVHLFQLSAGMTFTRAIRLGRNAIRRPAKETTQLNCFHLCHQPMSFIRLASGYRSNFHCHPGGRSVMSSDFCINLRKNKRKIFFSLKDVKQEHFHRWAPETLVTTNVRKD